MEFYKNEYTAKGHFVMLRHFFRDHDIIDSKIFSDKNPNFDLEKWYVCLKKYV